jgi:hypothetical protein
VESGASTQVSLSLNKDHDLKKLFKSKANSKHVQGFYLYSISCRFLLSQFFANTFQQRSLQEQIKMCTGTENSCKDYHYTQTEIELCDEHKKGRDEKKTGSGHKCCLKLVSNTEVVDGFDKRHDCLALSV